MIGESSFNRTTLTWVIGIGLLAFVGAAVAGVLAGDVRYSGSAGADSFSRSALGHQAFVRALKGSDIMVHQSQSQTVEKLNEDTFLMLLEPHLSDTTRPLIEAMLDSPQVLLVLPKRQGMPDHFGNRRWLGVVSLISEKQITEILNMAVPDASITRLKEKAAWPDSLAGEALDYPDLQLIESETLRPVVASDKGIFLGYVRQDAGVIWVMSDPDIIENHRIGRGRSAEYVERLVEYMLSGYETVVVDETSHGHSLSPSLALSAFSQPFLFTTILTLAALAAFVLGSTRRLGAPLPDDSEYERSKLPLITNIADLLEYGGNRTDVVDRYFAQVLRETALSLGAPAGLHGANLMKWVDDVAKSRGVSPSYSFLRNRAYSSVRNNPADSRRLLKLARELCEWKEKVLYGAARR